MTAHRQGPKNRDLLHETKQLRARLAEYNVKENRPYRLSMSVGRVFHDPEHPIALEYLLARGDAAMYEQKRAKRSERSCPDNTAQASGA
jgi:GGDEF domain-containing protein